MSWHILAEHFLLCRKSISCKVKKGNTCNSTNVAQTVGILQIWFPCGIPHFSVSNQILCIHCISFIKLILFIINLSPHWRIVNRISWNCQTIIIYNSGQKSCCPYRIGIIYAMATDTWSCAGRFYSSSITDIDNYMVNLTVFRIKDQITRCCFTDRNLHSILRLCCGCSW